MPPFFDRLEMPGGGDVEPAASKVAVQPSDESTVVHR